MKEPREKTGQLIGGALQGVDVTAPGGIARAGWTSGDGVDVDVDGAEKKGRTILHFRGPREAREPRERGRLLAPG